MNTVLVTVDALRADHLGQYGYHRDTMPVLDRLQERGTTFDSAFANGPHTVRSLPSLLTSAYHVADLNNHDTVGTILDRAGVETAAFHSNTALEVAHGEVPGFRTYVDYGKELGSEERHLSRLDQFKSGVTGALGTIADWAPVSKTALVHMYQSLPLSPLDTRHRVTVYVDAERVTNDAIEWMERNAGTEFFLWIHYMDPHRPYGVGLEDPEYADRVTNREDLLETVADATSEPDTVTDEQRRRLVDLYDSEIHYTSTHIARLLDAMDRLNVRKDTNVVFTADHGEEFGDHGMFDHQNRPYDELLRVPLIVDGPDARGVTCDDQRELVDVLPTVCTFHDVEVKADVAGTNLFEKDERTVVATGSIRDDDDAIAIRRDNYKYIHVSNGHKELYDLQSDPTEKRSVHDEHPHIVQEMYDTVPDGLLRDVEGTTLADQRETDDEQVEQRLEDLGYLD